MKRRLFICLRKDESLSNGFGMKKKLALLFMALVAGSLWLASVSGEQKTVAAPPRNIVIFVSDGLRGGSVTAPDAPTYFWVRTQGVNFINSHSLFPTFTTANASAAEELALPPTQTPFPPCARFLAAVLAAPLL